MQQAIDETRHMKDSLMHLLMADDQDEPMAVLEKRHVSLQVAMATIGKAESIIQEATALLKTLHNAERFLIELEGSIIELEQRIKDVSGRFLPSLASVWVAGFCLWFVFGSAALVNAMA